MTGTIPQVRGLRALVAALAATLALVATAVMPTFDAPAFAPASASPAAPHAAVDPAVHAALADDGMAAVIVNVVGDRALARAAVAGHGGVLGVDLPLVNGFAARVTPAALAALLANDDVRAIAHDGEVRLAHTPPLGEDNGDHRYDEVVGATDLHAAGIDGSGVGIAIIDTGITEVTDLAGRVVGGVDFSAEGTTDDSYGHGTFIAGIAAGNGSASNGKFAGVAPGAHVVPVKIAGRDGAADISHVLAAIQWVVSFKDDHGIRVLNLSLGTDSRQPNALSPLNYAVERAWDSGIVVVVSGGNRGADGPGNIPKPADDPLVITVGATDNEGTKPTGDDTVAPYSSRGPSMADGIVKPDIVAPGSHLIAPKAPGSYVDETYTDAHIRDDYMRASGTSFSAAVTSGGVALLLDAHPHWTPDQVKGAITSTAAPGPVGDRNVDGHGILDLAAAAALTDPTPANEGVTRSTGLGLMGDDRGGLEIEIVNDPLLGLSKLLTGETTAQDLLFDVVEYTTTDWTNSNWYNSNWYNSNWYNSNWYNSNWYNSNWYVAAWS